MSSRLYCYLQYLVFPLRFITHALRVPSPMEQASKSLVNTAPKNLSSCKIKTKDEKTVLTLSDLEKSSVGESNNGEGDDV